MRTYSSFLIAIFGVLVVFGFGTAYATPLSVVSPHSVNVTSSGQFTTIPVSIFGGQPYSGFNGSPDHYYLKVYDNAKLESEQNVNVGTTYNYQFYGNRIGVFYYGFVVYDSLGNSAQGDTVIKVGTIQPLKNYCANGIWNGRACEEDGIKVGEGVFISTVAIGGSPPYTFKVYLVNQNGATDLSNQISINGDIATLKFYPTVVGKYDFSFDVIDNMGQQLYNFTEVNVIADSQTISGNDLGAQPFSQGNTQGNNQGQNTPSSSNIVPVIAGVLVLVVIIAIIAIAVGKRKKKGTIAPPNLTSSTPTYESSSRPPSTTYEGSTRSPVMPLDEDEKAGDKTEVRVNVSMDIKNGVVQLKCNNCGAALPPPKDKSNWIKCEHCGGGYYVPKNIFDKL